MIFEGSTTAWLVLAILPIVFPVLLALILRHLIGVQSGCLPLIGVTLVGIGLAIGLAAFVDSSGSPVKGQVTQKRESVVYHADGSWSRKLAAQITYTPPNYPTPITRVFDLQPAVFDQLNESDFVDLQCPSQPGSLAVTRLARQKALPQVWYWITEQPSLFFFTFGVLFALAVCFFLRVTLPTLFFLVGLAIVGAWWYRVSAARFGRMRPHNLAR